jgi:hypothetical protein
MEHLQPQSGSNKKGRDCHDESFSFGSSAISLMERSAAFRLLLAEDLAFRESLIYLYFKA